MLIEARIAISARVEGHTGRMISLDAGERGNYTWWRVLALAAFGMACSTARAELAISLYTGTSHTHSSDLRVRQTSSDSDATFEHVHWQAQPFQGAPYYGLSLTYFPSAPAQWGGGLDFTHYKMVADVGRVLPVRGRWNGAPVNESAPMSSRIPHLEISHGVNLISLNLARRWSLDGAGAFLSRLQPELGAGVVGYLPHAEGSINDVPTGADYRWAGGGYQIFAGGEYRLTTHVSLLLRTKFDSGALNIDLQPDARLETHTRTWHAIGGVSIHFR